MRTKKVTRHYCEFCGRGSFKRPGMEWHEAHCTKNPDRKCGLCEDAQRGNLKELVIELRKRTGDEDFSDLTTEDMRWLREQTGDCPSCILSALRLSKVNAYDHFDFKKELEAWREESNRELRDAMFHPVP